MTFQLRNDPPPHKPWRGEEPEKKQQRVLFAGLGCLPGQQDLFATDGDQVTVSGTEYEFIPTQPKEFTDD